MFKTEGRATETTIGPSVHVEGDLTSQGDIVVEGAVTGTIVTTGNLTVGESASISANVQAASAYIAGKLKGNLVIANRLELAPTSKITGDVSTKTLVVSDGAQLDGRCQMSGVSATVPSKNSSRRGAVAPVEQAS